MGIEKSFAVVTWAVAHAEDMGVKPELEKGGHSFHPELLGPTWSLPGTIGWTLLELSAPFGQVKAGSGVPPILGAHCSRVTQGSPTSLPCSCCPDPGNHDPPAQLWGCSSPREHGWAAKGTPVC